VGVDEELPERRDGHLRAAGEGRVQRQVGVEGSDLAGDGPGHRDGEHRTEQADEGQLHRQQQATAVRTLHDLLPTPR
jgi:hypothetical protein